MLFGEKYGDVVRVVDVDGLLDASCAAARTCARPPQIGPFKILRESSVGQGVRRIEAITGRRRAGALRDRERASSSWPPRPADATPEKLAEAVATLSERVRELEKAARRAVAAARRRRRPTSPRWAPARPSAAARGARVEAPRGQPRRRAAGARRPPARRARPVRGGARRDATASACSWSPRADARGGRGRRRRLRGDQGDRRRSSAAGGGGRPAMARAGGKDASRLDEALDAARACSRRDARAQGARARLRQRAHRRRRQRRRAARSRGRCASSSGSAARRGWPSCSLSSTREAPGLIVVGLPLTLRGERGPQAGRDRGVRQADCAADAGFRSLPRTSDDDVDSAATDAYRRPAAGRPR